MIPYKVNPFGITKDKGYFELVVKPGILGASLEYAFRVQWNMGGYLHVIDWGDGYSQNSPTSGGNQYKHTYAQAGTYVIKMRGKDCWRIECGYNTVAYTNIVWDCNGNWNALGNITSLSTTFAACKWAEFDSLKELPDNVTIATNAFYNCMSAKLQFAKLPSRLQTAVYMFYGCFNGKLPISKLPENLGDMRFMFQNCYLAELPLDGLPSGLSGNQQSAFNGCNSSRMNISSLPDGITTGNNMFTSCRSANFTFKKLPSSLTSAVSMFSSVYSAINISELGNTTYNNLTTIQNLFYGSHWVYGSRSKFLAACPNVTTTSYAFDGTNTTE